MSKSCQNKGFTLLELLIVIGILAILATVAIFAINPGELLKRSRDSSRISDLGTLKRAIAIAQNDNPNLSLGICDGTRVYASIPSETSLSSAALLPSGWSFVQVSRANLQKTNGSGWIPINFQGLAMSSPLGSLPIDPLNTHNSSNPGQSYFFTYACNSQGQYELNAKLESNYYGFKNRDGFPIDSLAQNDAPLKDGGDNGLYETGTNLTILPKGGQCPNGMVWVPAPGRFCIDAYEATYSASGTKVDGTACSSNYPLSTYNTNPWSTRLSYPSVPQNLSGANNDAIDYCANMGKVLPTDFEWWLAAAGTPDPYNSKPARISGAEGPEPCMIWNTSSSDGVVERPQGSSQTTDGYVWGSDTNLLIRTGTVTQCKSIVGAYDMIGNLWERQNDLLPGGVYSQTTIVSASNYITAINTRGIPTSLGSASTQFNYDYQWWNADSNRAGLRSGSWNNGAVAGWFTLSLYNAPSDSYDNIGFRCALR